MIGTRPAHVPLFAARDLRGLAGGNTVAVEIEMTVAIGIEVDRVADPDRIARRPRSFGDPFGFVRFQIEGVEDVSFATAIPLFGSEVA